MRICALEVIVIVGVFNAPAVGAEALRGENTSLPQFMPSVARAGVANAEPAMKETRRAAEALSAKFSDDQPVSTDDAANDREKFQQAAPAAVDPPTNATTAAHVAVLRAHSPATATAPRKSKIARTKAGTDVAKSRSVKSFARRRQHPPFARGDTPRLTENSVPGAKAGWQTGLIGMLTNPAFWH